MKIGSHVSNNGTKMLVGSVEEALSYGANCLMVYLGAPQNTYRKPINEQRSEEALKITIENGINPEDIIVHAPYIVNLAQMDEEKFNFSIRFIAQELKNVDVLGLKYLVLHPGAHMGHGSNIGVNRIAEGINQILDLTSSCSSVITIETMSGKGTECGKSFEEIASIINQVKNKKRIAVCLDTCHINDAGYNIVDKYESVINEFDQIIGLNYLKVIHINDSKNTLASHKDRHENIGFGNIGFDTILKICNDDRFKDIVKILETPYVMIDKNKSFPPYKYEIEMIKKGVFNENLINEIKKGCEKDETTY